MKGVYVFVTTTNKDSERKTTIAKRDKQLNNDKINKITQTNLHTKQCQQKTLQDYESCIRYPKQQKHQKEDISCKKRIIIKR